MVPGDPGTLLHLLMPPSHGRGLGAEKMQPPQIPASVQKPCGRWPVGLSWTTCLSIFLENLEGTLVFSPLGQYCPSRQQAPASRETGLRCCVLPPPHRKLLLQGWALPLGDSTWSSCFLRLCPGLCPVRETFSLMEVSALDLSGVLEGALRAMRVLKRWA